MKDLRELIELSSTHYHVRNASPSEEDDGSMIKYWEETTGISLDRRNWQCPKCGQWFNRSMLDGAHVVLSLLNNHPQYITPLCQSCNREKDKKTFWILKDYVVPAP